MTSRLFHVRRVSNAVALIVFLAGATGVALAHEGEDHGAEVMQPALSAQGKRVVAALEGYASAYQSGDMDEIEKYVITGDGFSSLEGTYEDLGWESYRKHLAGELPLFKNTRYRLTNIRPYVRGDMAFAIMDYKMHVTIESDQFEGGKHEIEMKGKATMVLSKVKNEWKIRHIHTSRERKKKTRSGGSPH